MLDSNIPAAEIPQHFTLTRGSEVPKWHDWIEANKRKLTATIVLLAALATGTLIWTEPEPIQMPTVDCTIASGTSLIDCFGTNQNALKASITFAARYGLPIRAKLISQTLKPADALKLEGHGTDVVRISVPMSPGDKVIVPTDSQGNYVVNSATYVHNGKVVPPKN